MPSIEHTEETSPPTLPPQTGADIGTKLWSMANTLRSAGIRPADYLIYTLPVLMFKVVCDRNEGIAAEYVEKHGQDEYELVSDQILPFTIPPGASFTEQLGMSANLGESLRSALLEIEKNNSELAGVFLATDYAELSDASIRALYDTLSKVSFSPTQTTQDALGQAYEYLLGKFADAAGDKAGQFFTPHPVAQLMIELADPLPGNTIYDPTCGSGGLLNTAAEHIATHGHARSEAPLFGQEIDAQSYAIAKVNMFLHGNSGEVRRGDSLLDPKFTTNSQLRQFDRVVANPPFGLENSAAAVWPQDRFGRNRWGAVTKKPADLAFVAQIASSLVGLDRSQSTASGVAAIVLPHGALFRKGSEATMRTNFLKAGIVDAVIALPANLFYNTSIPASILILRTDRSRGDSVLFIDASQDFVKAKKKNTLTPEQVATIVTAYKTASSQSNVRALLVTTADIIADAADLTVNRWLPIISTVTVDIPAALAALRTTEAASAAASQDLWDRLKAAGYGN